MRSRFDSDPDSESGEEESRAKDLQLSSLAHKRGFGNYHETIMSEGEHSDVSETEVTEEDQPGEKESESTSVVVMSYHSLTSQPLLVYAKRE